MRVVDMTQPRTAHNNFRQTSCQRLLDNCPAAHEAVFCCGKAIGCNLLQKNQVFFKVFLMCFIKYALIHPTQQTTTERQMHTYQYSTEYDGYQLTATYEYEPADHDVGAPAVFTVVALSINDSPFDAMALVAPSVIEWLEDEIAQNHCDTSWLDAYAEWRDQQLMLEAA